MEQYSTRQKKVSNLLKQELSEYFRKEAKTVFGGLMISATVVRISKDLSVAKCYLSIFPSENGEEIVKEINKITPTIRFAIGNTIKSQVRIIPHLSFYVDDSLDYISNIDSLLKK